jgi:hypothetical protein
VDRRSLARFSIPIPVWEIITGFLRVVRHPGTTTPAGKPNARETDKMSQDTERAQIAGNHPNRGVEEEWELIEKLELSLPSGSWRESPSGKARC